MVMVKKVFQNVAGRSLIYRSCKLNRERAKIAKKITIYSCVASYFSLNLSHVLKKTNFGLVTHHIFTINITTEEDGFHRV